MNFDDCQALWQKKPLPKLADADTAALAATIRRVRADSRSFDQKIFWRDLREIIAALAVTAVFADMARTRMLADAPVWILALPLGVAAFLIADRLPRAPTPPPRPGHRAFRDRSRASRAATPAPAADERRVVSAAAGDQRGARDGSSHHGVASPSAPARLALALRGLAPRIEQLERERRDFANLAPSGANSPAFPNS